MSTRPANEIAIARARHISPFGNPIKEHNPCLSVRCSNFFLPFFFFLPPNPTIRPSPNFRGNLIFRKNAPPSIYPSRRSAAISRVPRARHDRRIFSSSIPSSPSSISALLASLRSSLFYLGFLPIISTLSRARVLEEYVTRRFSADVNRRLRDPTDISKLLLLPYLDPSFSI